jgi:hypothetical protein
VTSIQHITGNDNKGVTGMSITPTAQVDIFRDNRRMKDTAKQRKQALHDKLMLAAKLAEGAIDDAISDHEKPWRFNKMLGFRAGIATALTIVEEEWDIKILTDYIASMLK